ncbi:MAG: alkaline phosphatase D family protein [Flavobacteriaceae bacterium]|nr:alkaline phosphatase D family protein [Flavobacteriaceae bacterium]
MKIATVSFIAIILSLSACKEKLSQKKLKEIANTYGQFAPEDAYENGSEFAYYGSENEWSRRQFSEASANRLYKRRGQRQMLEILDGNYNKALELAQNRLNEDPKDAESYFIQAVAYCQLHNLPKAIASMNNALQYGMPFTRFMAGPKDLLAPLYTTQEYKNLEKVHGTDLVHGPLLGKVTDTSAGFWMRSVKADTVEIRCYKLDQPGQLISKSIGTTDRNKDYTTVITIDGLKAGTDYIYKVLVNGMEVKASPVYHFKTYPSRSQKGVFSIGFGGGGGYTPAHEKMWSTINSHHLDAMLLLGDNVYIDLPEMPNAFHDYTYYRRQSQPYFRTMVSSTPIYAIWDDHDAATDDVWLGPYKDKPKWKLPLLNVFKDNWNNPQYGTEETPGCWFKFSIADVDFFMLDGRTYRTNPFKEEKTMLGPVQEQWLLQQLKASTATFKVIVSPVPWAFDAKPGSHDTWAGFKSERNRIFEFLTKNKIEGVLLLSADRHRTDFWKNERTGDYPLYEFMSSRLTNIHTHDLVPGALFGYNEKCSFGKVTFNTELDTPEVTFEIVNIDNKIIHTYTVKRSELN